MLKGLLLGAIVGKLRVVFEVLEMIVDILTTGHMISIARGRGRSSALRHTNPGGLLVKFLRSYRVRVRRRRGRNAQELVWLAAAIVMLSEIHDGVDAVQRQRSTLRAGRKSEDRETT